MLSYLPISVLFTCFAISGLTNAFNILDGLNGLSAGVFLICQSSLGFIAYQTGDSDLAITFFVIACSIGGFLLINFPFGKIFMGDGGAYLIGFILAWSAILTSSRNPSVSPWACFLTCAYPIFEVLFSIGRRFKNKRSIKQADYLHLHSLLKQRFIKLNFLNQTAPTILLWCFSFMSTALAVIFSKDPAYLIAFITCFCTAYWIIYQELILDK